jgi:hypothetical protein
VTDGPDEEAGAGDPLQRIEDAANVRMVMTDGTLRTTASLLAPYRRP